MILFLRLDTSIVMKSKFWKIFRMKIAVNDASQILIASFSSFVNYVLVRQSEYKYLRSSKQQRFIFYLCHILGRLGALLPIFCMLGPRMREHSLSRPLMDIVDEGKRETHYPLSTWTSIQIHKHLQITLNSANHMTNTNHQRPKSSTPTSFPELNWTILCKFWVPPWFYVIMN